VAHDQGACRPIKSDAVPKTATFSLTLCLLLAGCSGGADTDSSGSPSPSESSTSAVADVLHPTPTPEITGEPRNGETLSGNAGTWGPGDVTLSYRWLRNGADIQGAVDSTYALTRDDVGTTISVRVTGTKPGFPEVSQESETVGPIGKAVIRSNRPLVSGAAVFDQQLAVDDLDWGSQDIKFRYQWLRDGVPIPGATRRTYRLGEADLRSRIAVDVSGRLGGFDPATERSAQTERVTTAEFTQTPRPRLTGTPRYFEILTVPDPGWRPQPTSLTYEWFLDDVRMSGISGPRYQVRGRDLGGRIDVQVIGTRPGYTTQRQFTAKLGRVKKGVFEPSPQPTISGTPAVDNYLTAAATGWAPTPVTFRWQWYRGDKVIRGATDSSYRLTSSDLGERIQVRARGTADFMKARNRKSAKTTRVQPGQLTRTPTPLYSGIAQVGETITALPKDWGPGDVSLKYQWLRGKKEIAGATQVTYVAVPADLGKRLRVRVTGSRVGYQSASQTSAFTDAITEGQLAPGVPSVSGLALEGETLTADPGSWQPDPVRLTYTWLRGGTPIDGASGPTYTLTAEDIGFGIGLLITGAKKGYADSQASSGFTDVVLARER
jgi:hypothetical protein